MDALKSLFYFKDKNQAVKKGIRFYYVNPFGSI
jgi:hypothetical protein